MELESFQIETKCVIIETSQNAMVVSQGDDFYQRTSRYINFRLIFNCLDRSGEILQSICTCFNLWKLNCMDNLPNEGGITNWRERPKWRNRYYDFDIRRFRVYEVEMLGRTGEGKCLDLTCAEMNVFQAHAFSGNSVI